MSTLLADDIDSGDIASMTLRQLHLHVSSVRLLLSWQQHGKHGNIVIDVLSACPSICPSFGRWYYMETADAIVRQ